MSINLILHWHYLIFLLPFGLSAFLLLLSSLHMGHDQSGHGGHHAIGSGTHINAGHTASHLTGSHASHDFHAGSHAAHGASHSPELHHADSSHGHQTGDDLSDDNEEDVLRQNLFLMMFGFGKVPVPMIMEAFFIIWGLSGCLANQWILPGTPYPTLMQMLPSLGIAAGSGLIGTRLAIEVLARVLPKEESSVVSREGLYGLKGKVAFPVSETTGRILIYDSGGSLHDENCRVAAGHNTIVKGCSVMIMDKDSQGNLIVEEISE